MSLVDPALRWWRRAAVWRTTAWTLWVIAAVVSAVAGWANAQYLGGAVWVDWFGGSEILSAVDGVPEPIVRLAEATVVALPFVLFAAGAADVIAGIVRDTGPAWALPRVVGIAAAAGGVGWLIAALTAPVSEPPLAGIVMLVVGIALLAIEPVAHRVLARRRAESQRVRAQGVRARHRDEGRRHRCRRREPLAGDRELPGSRGSDPLGAAPRAVRHAEDPEGRRSGGRRVRPRPSGTVVVDRRVDVNPSVIRRIDSSQGPV